MKVIGVRLEDEQVRLLETMAQQQDRTLSEVLRDVVERGLDAQPQPAPMPVPAPRPAPGPAPAPKPGDLPEEISRRLDGLNADREFLIPRLNFEKLQRWAPKALAAWAAIGAWLTHDAAICAWTLAAVTAALIGDGVWYGRDLRRAILDRAVAQLGGLIAGARELWEKGRATKSPQDAQADVLAFIAAGRARLGEWGVKDLAIPGWERRG